MLHPKASAAPIPISAPPNSPLNNSLAGAIRTWELSTQQCCNQSPNDHSEADTELENRFGGRTLI